MALYFNKTFVPVGGAAFILCSMMDSIFEMLGLLNSLSGTKTYCVYVYENEVEDEDDDDESSDSGYTTNRESLLSTNRIGKSYQHHYV